MQEDSLDSILSPWPSVKIQIIGKKVYVRQNIAGRCQQTFENKKFVDITQHCLPLHLKQTSLPKFSIYTEGDDMIKLRLPSKIFSTLEKQNIKKNREIQES